METQSLKQYLERKRALERSNTRLPSSELPAFRSTSQPGQRNQPLNRMPSYEPITQDARVPSLISLWRRYRMNPRQELSVSMESLGRELLELENNYGIVLLNPRVVDSAVVANKHLSLAQRYWQRSDARAHSHARAHANEALINQLRSLLESYRTVAAHRIVKSREFIEALNFFTRSSRLLRLHEEARAYYREARFHQKRREFNDAENFNRARRLFRKAILVTEELYLSVSVF